MKRFLLISGYYYESASGTGDWVGVYETLDEANAARQSCKDKGEDWYFVIDLQEVIETGQIPKL